MNRLSNVIKIMLFVLLALVLSSCTQAPKAAPESETRLLIHADLNYSVRYPSGYDLAIYSKTGLAIVQGSLLTIGKARADINVMPATSLTVEELVAEFLSSYPGSQIKQTSLVIDNESAVLLSGVPGQEVNRVIFVKHQESLFKLNFSPADPQAGEAYREMEILYKTVIESLDFEPQS